MAKAANRIYKITFEALFELLCVKEFEKIQVKEICEKANISRATFYRYFESKENIFYSFIESFFNEELKVMPNDIDLSSYLLGVFNFYLKFCKKLRFLALSLIRTVDIERVEFYLFDSFKDVLFSDLKKRFKDVDPFFVSTLTSSVIFGCEKIYINNGFKDEEKIVDLFKKLIDIVTVEKFLNLWIASKKILANKITSFSVVISIFIAVIIFPDERYF